jgi:hypothetical protein
VIATEGVSKNGWGEGEGWRPRSHAIGWLNQSINQSIKNDCVCCVSRGPTQWKRERRKETEKSGEMGNVYESRCLGSEGWGAGKGEAITAPKFTFNFNFIILNLTLEILDMP